MIRWDNIVGVGVALLLILTVHHALTVYSAHEQLLGRWFEQMFSEEQRPIVKLELLILALVVMTRCWLAARRHVQNTRDRYR